MRRKQPFKKTIYVVSARLKDEKWCDGNEFFDTKGDAHDERKLYQPKYKSLRSSVKIAKYQLVSVEDYPE